jgi:hypothetical protein
MTKKKTELGIGVCPADVAMVLKMLYTMSMVDIAVIKPALEFNLSQRGS